MKLWSGRFSKAQHPALDAINRSIEFDIRLWPEDVAGSRAHAAMLGAIGLLTEDEVSALDAALQEVTEELHEGRFEIQPSDEDIHTAVERRVTELAGTVGKKLHTGRSRNDQVATDLRLFVLREIATVRVETWTLIEAFADLAERYPNAALSAYTHLQRGQPVLLAHHLLAYVEMLRRDDDRLADCARRTNVSPLGSGACAGSNVPLDRRHTAEALGFLDISRNSLDAVSDRDFVLELLSVLSILMVHLSRLGEEMVLWCSSEFGFARPDDSVSTGSSMMPQKKNPDGAELMRGKAGRVFGSLVTMLTAMKGLPLSYNKDMQEDKEAVFDALDTAHLVLEMSTAMISTLQINTEALQGTISPDVFATDLAERLVVGGVPLRRAHKTVATLVRFGEGLGRSLTALSPDEVLEALADTDLSLDPAMLGELDLESSLASKQVPGGTAPVRVREAIAEVRAWLVVVSRGTNTDAASPGA